MMGELSQEAGSSRRVSLRALRSWVESEARLIQDAKSIRKKGKRGKMVKAGAEF